MSRVPREKRIIVIGDAILCLIGVAAGTDYLIFRGDCSEVLEFIKNSGNDYGVFIVSREVMESCRGVHRLLSIGEALTIVVDPPKVMQRIDPKKHYEELITKFVGMKISL